jgi:hypothetical protein
VPKELLRDFGSSSQPFQPPIRRFGDGACALSNERNQLAVAAEAAGFESHANSLLDWPESSRMPVAEATVVFVQRAFPDLCANSPRSSQKITGGHERRLDITI